jgi:hypothetical protein
MRGTSRPVTAEVTAPAAGLLSGLPSPTSGRRGPPPRWRKRRRRGASEELFVGLEPTTFLTMEANQMVRMLDLQHICCGAAWRESAHFAGAWRGRVSAVFHPSAEAMTAIGAMRAPSSVREQTRDGACQRPQRAGWGNRTACLLHGLLPASPRGPRVPRSAPWPATAAFDALEAIGAAKAGACRFSCQSGPSVPSCMEGSGVSAPLLSHQHRSGPAQR